MDAFPDPLLRTEVLAAAKGLLDTRVGHKVNQILQMAVLDKSIQTMLCEWHRDPAKRGPIEIQLAALVG